MRKFIVQTISAVAITFATASVMAQNSSEPYSFDDFASLFQKNQINAPFGTEELLKIELSARPQIDCDMYNWFIINGQTEYARRCKIDGRYFDASYGKIDCEPEGFSDGTLNISGSYMNKIYALGMINNPNYKIFIARIECTSNTYVDLYIFDNKGKFLSILCLYEDDGGNYSNDVSIERINITSQMSSDEIVHYEENRYSVNVKIDYQLQDDGVLKEIKELITGQYEVVDKDGYVNVRERPDGKSKVLYTIESGSVIKSRAENGSKWEEVINVEGSDKKGGYIHSSRLANYW